MAQLLVEKGSDLLGFRYQGAAKAYHITTLEVVEVMRRHGVPLSVISYAMGSWNRSSVLHSMPRSMTKQMIW